jgi:competence protein ComEC
VWSERSAAIVTAILIGDRAGLTSDVERRLQEAGTYHVIAISGGNIAIIAGLVVLVCRAVRIASRAAAMVVVAVLSVYALAIDGGPSVERATLMAGIYFTAGIWDHRAGPLNVAAIAAVAVLCANPLQVADAGFALTFGATLGILIGLPRIAGVWALSGWRRAPLALAAASVSAETALFPVSAFVFSRVTFAGLLVNFAAIPMMTVVQIAGTAAVAVSLVTPAAVPWVGWLAHLGVEGLIGSAVVVDWLPWLTRRLAPPTLAVVAAYYAALSIAMGSPVAAGWAARRFAAFGTLACGVWIVVAPATLRSQPRLLRVTFLDVGQGEAAVVQFPDGRTLGIDAGGNPSPTFDLASRVIAPAFWALGVRRLDYLSITHGDVDHIGGAASLFRDFRPFEVWEGVPVPRHLPTRELHALADAFGSPWRTLQPRDRMSLGDVELVVHHPPHPEWERQRIRNDDSEVLELRSGGVSFVFTGDIGSDVERAIAPGFARAAIRILKVPHHGSATSS